MSYLTGQEWNPRPSVSTEVSMPTTALSRRPSLVEERCWWVLCLFARIEKILIALPDHRISMEISSDDGESYLVGCGRIPRNEPSKNNDSPN